MANLKVNLYGMEFLNPIMTAAGQVNFARL